MQIRCDEGLRDSLRPAAREDGLLVAEAARRAIRAYVNRPAPSDATEAIWVAIAALAANALPSAGIKGFIASLKAYDAMEPITPRSAPDGIAIVIKVLEGNNLDA